MKLNILPLSQQDERWKLKRLGGSTVTIGSYGCLLTCHSMFLRYLGQDLYSDTLNDIYKTKGVYDPQGNINFWAAGTAFENTWAAGEYYQCIDIPCDFNKIDQCLDKKMPVIAMVDFDANPATTGDWHFVLVIGKENGSYLINDPWTGETYFFEAKYGDPARMIYGLRIYLGKEVPDGTTCEDQLSDCKVSLQSCEEALAGKSLEVNDLRTTLETQERDNKDLANQLIAARAERDSVVREKEVLAKAADDLNKRIDQLDYEVDTLQRGLDSAHAEVKALTEALAGYTSLKISDISTKDLYSELFYRLFHKKI